MFENRDEALTFHSGFRYTKNNGYGKVANNQPIISDKGGGGYIICSGSDYRLKTG